MIIVYTTFEISSFTCYEDRKGNAKSRNGKWSSLLVRRTAVNIKFVHDAQSKYA